MKPENRKRPYRATQSYAYRQMQIQEWMAWLQTEEGQRLNLPIVKWRKWRESKEA